MAISVAVADQPKTQAAENSCEKSCQVTSEQIKADMKAATESSRRSSGKGITTEAVEATARPGASATSEDTPASRTGVRTMTGSLVRVGPTGATSGQAGGCRSVVMDATHGTAPDRAASGREGAERPSVPLSSGPASVDRVEPRGGAVSNDPRRPGPQTAQGRRQPSSAATSGSQQENFVPRRPLTRSCTRTSSVSLVSETGKTGTTGYVLQLLRSET